MLRTLRDRDGMGLMEIVIALAILAIFAVGISLKGIPPSAMWGKLITLGCGMALAIVTAFFLARSGRRKTMSVAQFLTYDGERSFQFGER